MHGSSDRQIDGRRLAGPRERGDIVMNLKAPGILTFMLSVILVVCTLITKFFSANIPFITGNEFWVVLGAHALLVFGCVLRGL